MHLRSLRMSLPSAPSSIRDLLAIQFAMDLWLVLRREAKGKAVVNVYFYAQACVCICRLELVLVFMCLYLYLHA